MKVIEFLRVSTQQQGGDDRAGLPRQREANALTIRKHNLTLVKTVTIVDVSGTSVLHAPEVKELLQLVKSAYIKGIVVADWDRLIRLDNFRDFALLQHLKETNTLIFLPDQIIDLNTQSGFLIGGFQSIISGNELSQIKKRMLRAKEIKRKNGEHPNSHVTLPLGVGYDYKQRKFFYTDDIQKIKTLFSLFQNEGIWNYNELERRTGIHHRTIFNLLRNELYIGYRTYTEKRSAEKAIRPDGRQADRKKVKRQPDEIIRVKVIDKPAIDKKVFFDVQETIKCKNRQYHAKRSKEGQRFLYSGFIKCGACGQKMYSTSGGRNHQKDYYFCRSKNYIWKKKHGISNCSTPYLQRELVDNTVTSFVCEALTNKKYMLGLIEASLATNNHKEMQEEIETIKSMLRKIKQKRGKILDLFGEGLFLREELNSKISELNDETISLKMRLAKIEETSALKNRIRGYKDIEPIVVTLTEYPFWTPNQKRTFPRSQLPEITLTKDGITAFTLRISTDVNHMGMDSWRPPA
ncbi:MAG: recombinase family protein [Pseudomonadota bacterium]